MNDTLQPLARQTEYGLIHHRRRIAFAKSKDEIEAAKDSARQFYYTMQNLGAIPLLKEGWEIGASFDPWRLEHELAELFQQCHPIASVKPHPSIDVGSWLAAIHDRLNQFDEKLNLIAGRLLGIPTNGYEHKHTDGHTTHTDAEFHTQNAGQRAARLARWPDASADAQTSRRLPGTIRA